MKRNIGIAVAAALSAASMASAAQTLQMDLNAIGVQVENTTGAPSAFGGLNHTGAVGLNFASGISTLQGVFIDGISQNFSGSLTGMTADIQLTNGNVTGGNILVTVNGSDTYSCQIASVGYVETFVGGGFKIQGLTFAGVFSSTMFGNVDVTPWATGNLPGSFLQFNFNPDPQGSGYADMDLFVHVVPLPPAAIGGLAMLGGLMFAGHIRRRK